MKRNQKTAIAAVLLSTIVAASCSDDKSSSSAPTFDKVTTDKTTYQQGDTVYYTVSFKTPGENIGGTYAYTVRGLNGKTVATGTSYRYSPVSQFSEKFAVPDTAGTFIMTVSAKMMAAYAGNTLYLDPSTMGNVQCTFSVEESEAVSE